MKKVLTVFLIFTLVFTVALPVMASDIKVELNGSPIYFDVAPQAINNRTMVPLRAIFEALGATVNWDNTTKTVTSVKGNTTIALTLDSSVMYVNGKAVTLDAPACAIQGRTLVPVRAISEAFGIDVQWNNTTQTVVLTDKKSSTPTGFKDISQYLINNGEYNIKENSYTVTPYSFDPVGSVILYLSFTYFRSDDSLMFSVGTVSNGYSENHLPLSIITKYYNDCTFDTTVLTQEGEMIVSTSTKAETFTGNNMTPLSFKPKNGNTTYSLSASAKTYATSILNTSMDLTLFLAERQLSSVIPGFNLAKLGFVNYNTTSSGSTIQNNSNSFDIIADYVLEKGTYDSKNDEYNWEMFNNYKFSEDLLISLAISYSVSADTLYFTITTVDTYSEDEALAILTGVIDYSRDGTLNVMTVPFDNTYFFAKEIAANKYNGDNLKLEFMDYNDKPIYADELPASQVKNAETILNHTTKLTFLLTETIFKKLDSNFSLEDLGFSSLEDI